MCITEIWTYHECGCQYLDPIPCYDRVLLSPKISCKAFEEETSTSYLSLSSTPSVLEQDAGSEANEPIEIPLLQQKTSGSLDNTAAAYNHRLHLVRTCSIRQTVQKTFLKPVCDDCVLLELGLVPEPSVRQHRCDNNSHDEREIDGTEWLLESSVEITVEPPVEDSNVLTVRSKAGSVSSSSEDGGDSETPRRGRARRSAMEISRESVAIDGGSSLKSRTSFRGLKQTGQHLGRGRKQHDLQSFSAAAVSRPSKPPSTTPSSWIEHLRSDLGQRARRKRPDVGPDSPATHQNESSYDACSSASEDDRILSLPSMPATPSSAFSTTSAIGEESVVAPLNQLISSSEFDSSQFSSTHPPDSRLGILHPNQGESAMAYRSSSKSIESLHMANSTALPSSSAVAESGLAGNDMAISRHPLSCPLRAMTSSEHRISEEKTSEDEKKGHNEKQKTPNDKGDVSRGKARSDMLLMGELVEAAMNMSGAAPRSAV